MLAVLAEFERELISERTRAGMAAVRRKGNPQSRGLPTWTMLDPEMHKGVIALLPPEKQDTARGFFGVKQ